jgi:hypothetical protein
MKWSKHQILSNFLRSFRGTGQRAGPNTRPILNEKIPVHTGLINIIINTMLYRFRSFNEGPVPRKYRDKICMVKWGFREYIVYMVKKFLPLKIFIITYIFFESVKLFDTEHSPLSCHLALLHKNFKNKNFF